MQIKDQLDRSLFFDTTPKRVVSLVPSLTEYLYEVGLNDNELVGITKFCIKPSTWFNTIKRIGGTKTINIGAIKALKPDLVIANKEENERQQIEEISKHFPTYISDINTLEESYNCLIDIGKILRKEGTANAICEEISNGFKTICLPKEKKTALYFIWKEPYMVAGNDTFVNHLMQKIGLVNVATINKSRYPTLSKEECNILQPEFVLLSSEPFPFKEKHLKEFTALFPNSKIILVDGEAFSWYGSRLIYASKYFKELLVEMAL